jgi:uncharacterized repeat protein (TIGR01451 family)
MKHAYASRSLIGLMVCLGIVFAALPKPTALAAPVREAISPGLQQALDAAQPADLVRVIVRFRQQADLAMLQPPAANRRSSASRVLLVSALQAQADRSQSVFNAYLNGVGLAGQVETLQHFWIFNGLALRGTPKAILAIAAQNDVASVTLDEWRKRIDTDSVQPTIPFSRTNLYAFQLAGAQASLPWGIQQIRADQVWNGLGITGTGVSVGTIDTGVDWQHPALQSNYRGWNDRLPADHLHNWYDATDEAALYPTDMNGHGTHTMGTLVGQGGIGVAPGARWLAAKGLDGQGYGYDSWLHAAFQFMLAPGGDAGDAPDIVSNSWGNDDGSNTEFQADVAALNAAGIFVVFANGNNGPGAGTVGSPASLPGAIGIGATDPDDEVTSFSSRGPSPFGPRKPELSAPGLNVYSSYPGGRYAIASGTSMATPHVAGVAALLLSAQPTLSITGTLYVLTSTAVPLAASLPSNDTGWGRVDAYRAVLAVFSAAGVITGTVLDGAQPISAAVVTAFNAARWISATTQSDGQYSLLVPEGIYTLTAGAYGYYESAPSAPLLISAGQARTQDFHLSYLPAGVVRGTVRDVSSGAYLTNTLVSALGTPRTSLAGNGSYPPYRYSLDLPAGTYALEARLLGYRVQTFSVTVSAGAVVDADILLTPTQRIALVDTGAWYYQSTADYYHAALDAIAYPYDDYRVKHIPADTPTLKQLLQYDTVIWSAPFDSPAFIGAQDVISGLLQNGVDVLMSGQDIGYYDGGGYNGPFAYFNMLNARYVADDVASRVVMGAPGTLLAGEVLTLTGGDGANNQQLDDVVTTLNPDYGAEVGQYTASQNGYSGAGVYTQLCRDYRAAYFSFGLEAISSTSERATVLQRALDAFDVPRRSAGVELLSRDQFATGVPIGLPGQVLTHVLRLRNTGEAGITDTFSLSLGSNQWQTNQSAAQVTLAPCQSSLVTLTVSIPATATWNLSDVVTLTASSANSPSVSGNISFTTKTPAGLLLVDDDRFYNHEQDYLDALAANANTADRFDTGNNNGFSASPPLALLRMYPAVIWFNAYDWYSPISAAEEETLRQYLDGGGRLFFTSQAALHYTELSNFNQNYLGVAAIDFNDVTSNVVGSPGNVIGDHFAGGSLLPFPYGWNLSSAVQPLSGTQVILRGDSGQPFGLARECTACPAAWRTVFMPFAFETLPNGARADLMNRITDWQSWLGHSSFSASRASVAAGEAVSYSLQLRMDDATAPGLRSLMQSPGAVTTTLAFSVPLDANLNVISSTLEHASAHNAGEWRGAMHFGDVLSFTFVASSTPGLSDLTPLTATLLASLEEPGIHFSRQSLVYVNAPVLISTLTTQPPEPRWGDSLTFTLRVTNSGPIGAPAVSVTNAVPPSLTLLMPTLALAGPGDLTLSGQRIGWQGALGVGESITLSYAVSTPAFTKGALMAFYNAGVVDNGAGSVSQSALWVTPHTAVYYLPMLRR